MDTNPAIVSYAAPLFEAIEVIIRRECVLVQSRDKRICGIVTTADLASQFGKLAEPFLLLGEVENHVRGLIAETFAIAEIREAQDPRDTTRRVEDVSDLSFGEYVRLLEDPKRWEMLNLPIDRKTFIKMLETIRQIRNDVMHFDPEGSGSRDLEELQQFSQFLQRVRRLGSQTQ
jgi:hypothetical protein